MELSELDSLEVYQQTVNIDQNSTDYVSLTHNTISINDLFDRVKSSRWYVNIFFQFSEGDYILRAGAVSSFYGTTRDNFEGKEVTHLEYEAYPEMALKSMLEICSAVSFVRLCWDDLIR